MHTVLIVLLFIITLVMISIILLQRSESGGLSGGASSMGGLMSARGTANLLTKATGILAALFMGLCIILAILSAHNREQKVIITENLLQSRHGVHIQKVDTTTSTNGNKSNTTTTVTETVSKKGPLEVPLDH